MIRYAYFTRAEAIEWQKQHPVDPADPLTDIHTNYYEYCDMDQRVGIGAWDGERMIGRNLFFHCPIMVDGRPVECVVTNNLYVAPEYRPKGIGTYLKMYVLKLGYPQISSGVSPAMQKVYNAWHAYRRVDASPTYSIPTSILGLIRVSRLAAEQVAEQSNTHGQALPKLIIRRLRSVLRLLNSRYPGVRCLKPDEAAGRLDSLLHVHRAPVQVPWSRRNLIEGLEGRHHRLHAWIIDLHGGGLRLITGYTKQREIRTVGTRTGKMTELLLNEIWPPLDDADAARACLAFTARRARSLGVSVVQVDGMTETLRRTCQDYGFDSLYNKRVYIAPNTRDKALDGILSDPANWWCRAINEDEFEEIAIPRSGATEFSDFIPLESGNKS